MITNSWTHSVAHVFIPTFWTYSIFGECILKMSCDLVLNNNVQVSFVFPVFGLSGAATLIKKKP